jgi:hypothetical protein
VDILNWSGDDDAIFDPDLYPDIYSNEIIAATQPKTVQEQPAVQNPVRPAVPVVAERTPLANYPSTAMP